MIENATGLILRTYPLTETSLIIRWLTAGYGRISTVAKGARRPKSSLHGKLDLFYLVDFSFSRSRRSELHTLREATILQGHNFIRRDLGYLHQACYCASLVELATETETPLPEVFSLFVGLLECLPLQPPMPQTMLAFELKLLAELGLEPSLEETRLSGGARDLALHLRQEQWPSVAALTLDPGPAKELRSFLQRFLVYHLGHSPNGREAAMT